MIEVTQINGTDKTLYKWVAPLVMNPEVLHYNNNYPFKTNNTFTWFIAHTPKKKIIGFFPVEHRRTEWIINNYYATSSSDETEEEVFTALLAAVEEFAKNKENVTAVVQTRHKQVFESHGFQSVKEWKLYTKMKKNG